MKFPGLVLLVACSLTWLPAATAAAAPKKILVVTVTTGFRHSSIATAEATLAQLAEANGAFTVEFVRQPAGEPKAPARPRPGAKGAEDPAFQAASRKFEDEEKAYESARAAWLPGVAAALQAMSPANLQTYDAVMFLSTTGELPLPDAPGFLDWIATGKAFVGVHAAADTFHAFPPFVAMLGGEFRTHGPQVSVDCVNRDPAHAACAPLPKTWTVFDEIYQFKNFDAANVHGLLALRELSLTGKPEEKTPGDYPVAWTRRHGKGRVFYTSLGHREDMWDPAYEKGGRKNAPEIARQFQRHLLGGILWALDLAPAP